MTTTGRRVVIPCCSTFLQSINWSANSFIQQSIDRCLCWHLPPAYFTYRRLVNDASVHSWSLIVAGGFDQLKNDKRHRRQLIVRYKRTLSVTRLLWSEMRGSAELCAGEEDRGSIRVYVGQSRDSNEQKNLLVSISSWNVYWSMWYK